MQQTAEARSPSVKKLREHIASVISDKHQPIITKSGRYSDGDIIVIGQHDVLTLHLLIYLLTYLLTYLFTYSLSPFSFRSS